LSELAFSENSVLHCKYKSETNFQKFSLSFFCPVFCCFRCHRIVYASVGKHDTESLAASVFMEPKVLLIAEVAALLRVSQTTIYRWTSESRAGRSDFPAPISRRKGKNRWLAADIERYIESQSAGLPEYVRPAQRKKDYQCRQDAAVTALARHGIRINQ
jgi:predicted DNA-binding transcriptional regulator AlpA